jgi:hypothetical protein
MVEIVVELMWFIVDGLLMEQGPNNILGGGQVGLLEWRMYLAWISHQPSKGQYKY